MPAAPPAGLLIGSVVRVTLATQTKDTVALNSFVYFNAVIGSVTPADLVDLSTAWKTLFDTDVKACLSPKTTLLWTYLAEIHYGTCPSAQFDYAGGTIGTSGATSLPMEVAAVISKYSGLKGKHGRGRIYMPGVPDTFVSPATDPDVLNAAALTAYNQLRADMIAVITAGAKTWTPIIPTSPVPPATLVDFGVTMTRTVLRTTLATIRRRKKGRGI